MLLFYLNLLRINLYNAEAKLNANNVSFFKYKIVKIVQFLIVIICFNLLRINLYSDQVE